MCVPCSFPSKVVARGVSLHLSNAIFYKFVPYGHSWCIGHRHMGSAHRRILGMASVVCVLVKICVSSISLYKLDTDKLTAPFESAHQFALVCTVSDSETVPGCHYNLCSNHSFVLTDSSD